jgi:dihydropteroate synthase
LIAHSVAPYYSAMQPAIWQSPHGRPLPAPGGRTLIMGVLNVTPDSFSDGGQLPSTQAVVDRAGAMLTAGADVLDVGGESTRPGGAAVSATEECDRVLPAMAALRRAFSAAPLSIDTYKAAVAAAAVQAGADIVNDIWGCLHGWTADERRHAAESLQRGEQPTSWPPSPMAGTVAALHCPVILMHNRPDRNYGDFWADLMLDLRLSLAVAQTAGVPDHQIWLDPGFGFGKNPPHNLEVLKHLDRIVALGHPVLLGTSRKSTIGLVLGTPVNDRMDGTGATIVWGIQQGCHMVRVHDVAAMLRFVRMTDAIKAGIDWKP